MRAQHNTALGDQADLILFLHDARRHYRPGVLADLINPDTFAPASLCAELIQGGAPALTVERDDEKRAARLHHLHADDGITLGQTHSVYPSGGASHGSHVMFVEANSLSFLCD